MRTALVQFTGSDDPADNLARLGPMIDDAAAAGAGFVLTPEVSNCISGSRTRQEAVLVHERDDPVLNALRDQAARLGIWLLAGSVAVKTQDPDGRYANRSVLVGPDGAVAARYDKIHMFDVAVTETETYRESRAYRPGTRAVLAQTPFARIGLTVCYDVRFPHLYRRLAQAGAQVLTVPSAFSPVTGAMHWAPLLRARAIETGCFVLAPAQTGTHPATRGRQRETWGHALAVSPWGEILADAGTGPGLAHVDLDMAAVEDARRRVPSLNSNPEFDGPE
ncbi:carbon-nitrogen hydrolase family protein [Roseovarius salinarum]|uniref:carbon-nitrogen hydrolase family protein n=1 Tax=Roseovarius salinarum TaxID=1981892 RepID=UPI000C335BC2|nr:carbon-nitrogen hydrolase family protein [Roseovarius salinarum]